MAKNSQPFADWQETSGYSMGDLAFLCGVSRQTVSAWKNYKSLPSLSNFQTLEKLSKGQLTPDSFKVEAPTEEDVNA